MKVSEMIFRAKQEVIKLLDQNKPPHKGHILEIYDFLRLLAMRIEKKEKQEEGSE